MPLHLGDVGKRYIFPREEEKGADKRVVRNVNDDVRQNGGVQVLRSANRGSTWSGKETGKGVVSSAGLKKGFSLLSGREGRTVRLEGHHRHKNTKYFVDKIHYHWERSTEQLSSKQRVISYADVVG